MAVVPRKYKRFTTYYAVNTWKGKQIAEKVGRNEREAQSRDSAMRREIKADRYSPPASRVRDIVGGFGAYFVDTRTNPYARDERRLFTLHILSRAWCRSMHLDDWTPAHTKQLVEEMRAEKKADGSRRLSDKSIGNAVSVLSTMFEEAVLQGRCLRNPAKLRRKELKRKPAQEKEIYSVGELVVLINHHSIPWPLRVLNALCLLTGMREGEACGRRWKDLDDESRPLGSIYVHDQYNGLPLKQAEQPRMVPMHHELASVLTAWAQEGFELYTGRAPGPDDYIVPAIGNRAKQPNWTRSQFYKAFVKHAKAAGVRPRTLHSTRHTFISLARRGGADKSDLEKVTHNAQGDIIDRYTHKDWAPLCEAVLCLRLDVLPELHPPRRNPGDSGGKGPSFLRKKSPQIAANTDLAQGSIPGASTRKEHKTSQALKPRKERLQYGLGDLREDNRARKRRLLSLVEADPEAAAAPLALARALDAAYQADSGQADEPLLLKQLAKAYHALGLGELVAVAVRGGQ